MSYGPSDVIEFKDLNTGGNAAGNGGNGYNHGNLENSQTAKFSPHNKAVGVKVVDASDGIQIHTWQDPARSRSRYRVIAVRRRRVGHRRRIAPV